MRWEQKVWSSGSGERPGIAPTREGHIQIVSECVG
jgi:hypothetical protein